MSGGESELGKVRRGERYIEIVTGQRIEYAAKERRTETRNQTNREV